MRAHLASALLSLAERSTRGQKRYHPMQTFMSRASSRQAHRSSTEVDSYTQPYLSCVKKRRAQGARSGLARFRTRASQRGLCVIIAGMSLWMSGCVKKSTFEALQAKHRTALQENATLAQQLQGTRSELSKLQADYKGLDERYQAEQKRSAKLISDRSALQSSVEEMEGALREQRRRQAEADARIASFRALLDRFRPLIDTGKLKVKIVDGRMVLVLATDILFDPGSASLSEEGKVAIMDVAGVLSSFPDRAFQVEGHTDNDPISTRRYPSNWDLAADRALNVVKAMIEGGLPATQISGASYGEQKPVANNEEELGKAQNRRIEIVILPDLSKLPGFDELKRLQPTSR